MRPEKVSKELSGALAEEQKRHAIDAAKKKAVAQHADYDTFKKMVSVAHLKPLHAPSGHGSKGCSLPAWQLDPSTISAKHRSETADAHTCSSSVDAQQHGPRQPSSQQHPVSQAHTAAAAAKPASVTPSALPCTSQEFARDWRKHCPTAADKYKLLQRCGPVRLAQIFKVEVDSILLGQILQVIQQQWKHTAAPVQQRQQQHAISAPQQCSISTPSASQQQQQQQQEDGAEPSATQQEQRQQQEVALSAPQQQQQQQQRQQPAQAVTACLGHNMAAAAATAAGAEDATAGTADDALVAEAVMVVGFLQSLAGAGRFDLNVRLMGKLSKAAAAELCSQLQELLQQHAPAVCSPSGPADCVSASGSNSSSSNSSSSSSNSQQRDADSDAGGSSSSSREPNNADSAALADLQAIMLKLHV